MNEHVMVMFGRMRLLLADEDVTCVDTVLTLLDDIEMLVATKHSIAAPIAQRVGVELMTAGRKMQRDVKRALRLSKERFAGTGCPLIALAMKEVRTFRRYMTHRSKKMPPWLVPAKTGLAYSMRGIDSFIG